MGHDDEALVALTEDHARKKSKKKRHPPGTDVLPDNKTFNINHEEAANGVQIDDNEPTIAEKLATIDIKRNEDSEMLERKEFTQAQLPTADSVQVLLKQALHAEDRALLLDCLYNQDEKVIANSVSLLNSTDSFKLLNSLISIIQSRGAVVVCAIPWLRSLLLQHASNFMSQDSSLVALNSLYQIIESRVATLGPAFQLATQLDLLDLGDEDGEGDEFKSITPVIYEDKDSEEEAEDAMDTDEEDNSDISDD